MAQVFRPSGNTLARVSLFVIVMTPLLLIVTASAITRSSYNTNTNMALKQPVPFSHKHHVSDLGIDCRYCHTSVEKSSFAGVPPTHTCMSCHSQIWTNSPLLEPLRESYRTGTPLEWTRINKLPEFVYFDHGIHVNRGISCNQCHGAVQEMQLTEKPKAFFMVWCLECHRNPEKYLYQDKENPQLTPTEQVFELYKKQQRGEKVSRRERALLDGRDYNPTPDEMEEGRRLVKERGVKTEQLTDCWICHR